MQNPYMRCTNHAESLSYCNCYIVIEEKEEKNKGEQNHVLPSCGFATWFADAFGQYREMFLLVRQ